MIDKHFAFIFAAYAVTALVIGAMIVASMVDYRRLRAALDKLPRRGDEKEAAATGTGKLAQ